MRPMQIVTPLEALSRPPFRLGAWRVDPARARLVGEGGEVELEARALRLLLRLAEQPGALVSIDDLLSAGWPDVVVSPDSVYQAITGLRRVLGDSSRQPAYIATVPRSGYRLVAAVTPMEETLAPVAAQPRSSRDGAPPMTALPAADRRLWLAAALGLLMAGGVGWWLGRRGLPEPRTLAVLPFADLTESMDEEPFADGVTEQLIEALGRIPGLRVSARTASFVYKDKPTPLAEIARALDVAFVLEGSVRKSAKTLRVTARLVRVADSSQLWSQNYDRPYSDILAIQDEIAAQVRQALERGWAR